MTECPSGIKEINGVCEITCAADKYYHEASRTCSNECGLYIDPIRPFVDLDLVVPKCGGINNEQYYRLDGSKKVIVAECEEEEYIIVHNISGPKQIFECVASLDSKKFFISKPIGKVVVDACTYSLQQYYPYINNKECVAHCELIDGINCVPSCPSEKRIVTKIDLIG